MHRSSGLPEEIAPLDLSKTAKNEQVTTGLVSASLMKKSLVQRSLQPTDGASLAVFRFVFGLALVVYAIKAIAIGEVRGIYVDPAFHFSYWGLDWLRPWPGNGMYLHFVGIAFFAFLLAIGLLYRLSSICLAVLFTYLFSCESTGYLNHYYLVMLLCWMMAVVPADRALSIDGLNRSLPKTIPCWALWTVRWHIGIPYFFGGIAKLNSDWLSGQPMRMTLTSSEWFSSVATVASPELIVLLFSWGGLLFDLLIVPALIIRRTRPYAFCASLVFHLTNAFVFPIGIFPWLMIGATTIFFNPSWPRQLMKVTPVASPSADTETLVVTGRQKWFVYGLIAYAALHCLVPLRHLVTQGNPSWTECGHHFAWHMMLRGKRSALRMYVTNPATGATYKADLRNYLTAYQYPKVARDPEHIRQLAHHIAEHEARGSTVPEVRAFSLVSLNGRKAQLLIDPAVNLAAEPAAWVHPQWIVPLKSPVRRNHWDVPLLEWETVLDIHGDDLINSVVFRKADSTSSKTEGRLGQLPTAASFRQSSSASDRS